MRRKIEWAIALSAALIGAPAWAQPPNSDPPRHPPRMPQIPAALRGIVTAVSPQHLELRYRNGETHPFVFEYYEVTGLELFRDGRYLGIRLQGDEDYGYMLIDLAGPGHPEFDTGDAPIFSADGHYFAAAEISESSGSNLEGIAIWQVGPNETFRRLFINALPAGQDWRVDDWAGPDCVRFSAVAGNWRPRRGVTRATALRTAPRNHFGITVGDQTVFHATEDRAACGEEPETR